VRGSDLPDQCLTALCTCTLQWLKALFTITTVMWLQQPCTHTHTRCPGLPGWAGTRKVKPIWILLEQETVSGSGISWAICKSALRCRQITTPAPHRSDFYRPDALPAAQPTASVHWRQQPCNVMQFCVHNCDVTAMLLRPEINRFIFLRDCSQSQCRNRCGCGRPAVASLFTVVLSILVN